MSRLACTGQKRERRGRAQTNKDTRPLLLGSRDSLSAFQFFSHGFAFSFRFGNGDVETAAFSEKTSLTSSQIGADNVSIAPKEVRFSTASRDEAR